MKKQLYRVDEVSEIISKSERSIYNLLDSGDLQGHNVNPGRKGLRITAVSVEQYIQRYTIPASQ